MNNLKKMLVNLIVIAYSCTNTDTIKDNNSSIILTKTTLNVIEEACTYTNVVLENIGIDSEHKGKYFIKSLLSDSELIPFRNDVKQMKFLFNDTTDIDFMIDQSKVKIDSTVNNIIIDRFIHKSRYKLIENEKEKFLLKMDNNIIIYKMSYPFYTKSKNYAIVVIRCNIKGKLIAWANILSHRGKNKWNEEVVLSLGKDGFAMDFLKKKHSIPTYQLVK